jgi:hypothetical protein
MTVGTGTSVTCISIIVIPGRSASLTLSAAVSVCYYQTLAFLS